MNYANYYLQASQMSDRIREESRETTKTQPKPKPFVNKRTQSVVEQPPADDLQQTILEYFNRIDSAPKAQDFMPESAAPESSPRPPVSRRGDTYAPMQYSGPEAEQLARAKGALAKVESGGESDPYAAVGPVVEKGMYKGQRAIGKYQVMEGNIPAWTKEILGKEMTVEEFKATPGAQEAVVDHRLMQAKKKHGTWEDAASVWFSGRPVKEAMNADDGYTSVPEYVAKFQTHMKG